LASLAIDVHPPRASRAARWRRHWLPIYWLTHGLPVVRFASGISGRISRGISDLVARIKAIPWRSAVPWIGLVLRTIIPGWAHWHTGRRTRAVWIFACYLGLLVLALLFARSRASYQLIEGIIVFHAASVADALPAKEPIFWRRFLYFALAWLVLSRFVYGFLLIGRLIGWL
jgi:hypothetical protein